MDNSGWYSAVTNPKITSNPITSTSDVYIEIDVVSNYNDNDIYNSVFVFFCVVGGILLLMLITFIVLLKCQAKKYNKLMEEKSEFLANKIL